MLTFWKNRSTGLRKMSETNLACIDVLVTQMEIKSLEDGISIYTKATQELEEEFTRIEMDFKTEVYRLQASDPQIKDLLKQAQDLEDKITGLVSGVAPDTSNRVSSDADMEAMADRLRREAEAADKATAEGIETSQPVKTVKKSKALKTLYKKLASLTHPDKQPNPELTKLFPAIKSAYDANDLETLTSLSEIVFGLTSPVAMLYSSKTTLAGILEKLKGNYKTAHKRNTDVKASAIYMAIVKSKGGDTEPFKQEYTKTLKKNLAGLQNQYATLKFMSQRGFTGTSTFYNFMF